jgi:hypothetical protein
VVQRLFFASLFVGALLGTGHPALAQTPPPDAAAAAAAVTEIRQTIDAAWKDVQAYRSGGGKPATPDHPALKWHATLWAYREQHPGTEAAARATADAIRLLVRGEFWEQAHARTEVVAVDDPAWERLSTAIYEEGSTRKDFAYTLATLSRVAAATTSPTIKSAVLLDVGRARRRQGDLAAAKESLAASRSAAPGSASSEEADRVLYEITHLSVGLPAPTFSAKGRNGKTVDLAALHGRAVVLVFWSTT